MKTIKILFADDDLKYSMLLKRFLETEGYEVTYAGNGNIALQQFPLIKPIRYLFSFFQTVAIKPTV